MREERITFDGEFDHVDVLGLIVGDDAEIRSFVVLRRGVDLQVMKGIVVAQLILLVVDQFIIGSKTKPEDIDWLGALHLGLELRRLSFSHTDIFRSEKEFRIVDARIHPELLLIEKGLHLRGTENRGSDRLIVGLVGVGRASE